MTRLPLVLALVAVSAHSAAANDLDGTWLRDDGNARVRIGEPEQTSWGTDCLGDLCFSRIYQSTETYHTAVTQTYRHSIKADVPIGIEFFGYDSGAINVNSVKSVHIGDSIINRAGATSITSTQGSIQQLSPSAIAYTSALKRAQRTLDLMLEEMGQTGLPVVKDQALNERDYGDLSGLNKDDARKKWGEEQVHIWRRSYDVAPPGGESLKDTLARTLPYYVTDILPRVLRGERVLIAAHGNSLRALVMVLERLSPEQILKREIGTGVPIIYRLGADALVTSKLDLAA